MGLRLSVRSGWGDGEAHDLDFDQDRIVVGRRAGCDVQLPHAAVSGHHATIRADRNIYSVIDSSSTNGVRVNEQRLIPGRAKQLSDGDQIRIGGFVLAVSIRAVGTSATAENTRAIARRLLQTFDDEEEELPSLFFVNGERAGASVPFPAAPCSLVAGRGAALHVPDGDASREHAEFVHDLAGVQVNDLNSKNGVLVGGTRVRTRRLRHGDELQIGATRLRYDDPAGAALEALAEQEDQSIEEAELPEPKFEFPAESVESSPEESSVDMLAERVDEPANLEAFVPPPISAPAPRADLAIYALAGTILALSIAGLVWLVSN